MLQAVLPGNKQILNRERLAQSALLGHDVTVEDQEAEVGGQQEAQAARAGDQPEAEFG